MGKSSEQQRVYTLEVRLGSGSAAIEIAGSHTLEQLAGAILDGFAVPGKPAWEFQVGGRALHDGMNRRYGPPGAADDGLDDAGETTLDDLKLKPGKAFWYLVHADRPTTFSLEVSGLQKGSRAFDDPRFVGRVAAAPVEAPERRPAMPPPAPRAAPPVRSAQAAACSYILVALLQRLDDRHPGLTADLLAGVEADRAAVPPENRASVDEVFEEALTVLRRASRRTPC